MIQTVQYESCARLSCAGCLPAEVVLCLDEEIVASGHSFIEATLISACKTYGSCNSTKWKYTFEYDSDLLVDSRVLVPSDIGGVFCKGCLTNWVESLVSTLASDSFTTITFPYGDDIVADSPNDTLNFIAGDCVYLESDAETDTITISVDPECIGGSGGACCQQRLYINIDETGETTSGTTETDLMSYTLPLGTLLTNDDSLQLKMLGIAAVVPSEGNGATFRVYLGSELLAEFFHFPYELGGSAYVWELKGEIQRVTDTTYESVFFLIFSEEYVGNFTTVGAFRISSGNTDFGANQLIKLTGEVSVGSDSITQNAFFVDKINAP